MAWKPGGGLGTLRQYGGQGAVWKLTSCWVVAVICLCLRGGCQQWIFESVGHWIMPVTVPMAAMQAGRVSPAMEF